MFNKKNLIAGLASMLLLAACNLGGGAPQEATDTEAKTKISQLPEVIKIGVIAPLTGNAASIGQDVKLGVSKYFTENPTINGKTVEVIYEDGKCNGQDAANAAQKLINVDKVQMILGGQCSGETLAAAPIAEQNQVILFSQLSSSPEVTTAGEFVYRNFPSDEQVAKTMVDTVLENEGDIALLSEQTDYAQAYREAVKRNLEDKNATDRLVMDEVFPVDSADFRTLLTKAKDLDVKHYITVPQTPITGAFIAKQARELGVEGRIYAGEVILGPDFFETAKDAAEGVISVAVAEDPTRNGFKEFSESIAGQVQFGALFAGFAYDAAALTAKAIQEVGYNSVAIKKYFDELDSYSGVASDINFDENGDNNIPAGVKVARDGEFVLVTE